MCHAAVTRNLSAREDTAESAAATSPGSVAKVVLIRGQPVAALQVSRQGLLGLAHLLEKWELSS